MHARHQREREEVPVSRAVTSNQRSRVRRRPTCIAKDGQGESKGEVEDEVGLQAAARSPPLPVLPDN